MIMKIVAVHVVTQSSGLSATAGIDVMRGEIALSAAVATCEGRNRVP
jgi:hypothetical protein